MKRKMSKTIQMAQIAMLIGGIILILPLMGFMQKVKKWEAPMTADKVLNPVPINDQSIAAGKTIYTNKCVVCHGKKGKGDGPKSSELDVEVGNLTTAEFAKQSDGAIFWKTSEGKNPMPSYKVELTADERWQVINFVRGLGKVKQKN
jgi:mono/diheme cytochrome c family protein